jgi:hypothetical protein
MLSVYAYIDRRFSYNPVDLIVLMRNIFVFDNECYLQVIGVAMGSLVSPPFACLFMGAFNI